MSTKWKIFAGYSRSEAMMVRCCSVFMCAKSLGHVWLFVTLWTIACQAPLSMEFCRQEYWSGLPFLPPGDIPDPGIKPTSPGSPAPQVDSLPLNCQGSLNSLYRWSNKGTQKLMNVSKTTQIGHGRPMMRTKPFSLSPCSNLPGVRDPLTLREILKHLECQKE